MDTAIQLLLGFLIVVAAIILITAIALTVAYLSQQVIRVLARWRR